MRTRPFTAEYVHNERELVYKSLEAADHAEVSSAALMTDGRPLMPAVLIAMTKGDLAAVEVLRFRSGWLYGTNNPIIVTPPM